MLRATLLMVVLAAGCTKHPSAKTAQLADAATARAPAPTTAGPASGDPRLPTNLAELSYPEVPHTPLGMAPDALVLTLTRHDLLLEGMVIDPIRDGRVDPSALENGADGIILIRLAHELDQHMQRLGKLAALKHEPSQPALVLLIDKDTPGRTLAEVLATTGRAGFTHLAIAVHGDGGNGVLALDLPASLRFEGDAGAPADHAVEVTAAGFELHSLSGPTAPASPAGHDLDQLRELISALPGQTPILLIAAADARFQDVAAALAAISRRADGTPLREVWLGKQLD